MKPVLELLNAVPTVVYGYFALLFVAPLLQKIIPDLPLFSMLSAGMVMGIMIVPYVSSLSEDAMRSVPMILREGSYALGRGQALDGACAWWSRRRSPASARLTSWRSRGRSARR